MPQISYTTPLTVTSDKAFRFINDAEVYTRAPLYFNHFAGALPLVGAAGNTVEFTETKTGTGALGFVTTSIGGVVKVLTTAASGDALAEVLTHGIWNPSKMAANRPLSLECRALLPAVTLTEIALGFTDQSAVTAGIAYTVSAASAVTTSTPADGAAWFYSSVPTSGALFNSGGNNFYGGITSIAGTDTVFATATASDTNYHVFRVEVDASGDATFYLDDKLAKVVVAAVTANSNLSPFVQCVTRTTAAKEVDVDYLMVSGGVASTTT